MFGPAIHVDFYRWLAQQIIFRFLGRNMASVVGPGPFVEEDMKTKNYFNFWRWLSTTDLSPHSNSGDSSDLKIRNPFSETFLP